MLTVRYKYTRVLVHILIWSLLADVLFRYPHTEAREVPLPPEFVTKQIVHMGIMLFAYYFNTYYLVPRLLLKKRYIQFVTAIILLVLGVAAFMTFVARSLELQTNPAHWDRLYLDRFTSWTTLIVVGISTLLAIMAQWNADSKKIELLERERIQTELSALRAQIHPHFLFNTLHTVYALSYTDSEASRKALAQVSRLLRYQLYEVQRGETTLDKELAFIRDYISIMRLRMSEKINLDLQLPQQSSGLSVAPMILICYIENIFKHGVVDKGEGNILIAIELSGNSLSMRTRNKIAAASRPLKEEGPTGIGMQNTLRRLELLYPDRYQLAVKKDTVSNEFELTLTLQLA